MENILELQDIIGIKFNDINILNTAITHSSYTFGRNNVSFYERLEFLGDAVLQLCISNYLFNKFKNKEEGELTRLRALIVCEHSLYEIAKTWNLGKYLNISKGEELTGGRERVSILADCVEAIIAAIYIDNGFSTAETFILKNFKFVIDNAIGDKLVFDYKTRLQEFLQKHGEIEIRYDLIKFEGPPHRRKFYSSVSFDGKNQGEGIGLSKKESEQEAAKAALLSISHEE